VLMSVTSSFLTLNSPNSSSSSSSLAGSLAFLPFLLGVPSAASSVAPRLPDFGVRARRGVVAFLGVLTTPVEAAALSLSLRLILPSVTEALPSVYYQTVSSEELGQGCGLRLRR
jgi:hypothetical protein